MAPKTVSPWGVPVGLLPRRSTFCGVHGQLGDHALVVADRQQAIFRLNGLIMQMVFPAVLEE